MQTKAATSDLECTEEFPEKFPNKNWEVEVSKVQKYVTNLDTIIEDLKGKNTKMALVEVDAGFIIFRKWEEADNNRGSITLDGKRTFSRINNRVPIRGRLVEII